MGSVPGKQDRKKRGRFPPWAGVSGPKTAH